MLFQVLLGSRETQDPNVEVAWQSMAICRLSSRATGPRPSMPLTCRFLSGLTLLSSYNSEVPRSSQQPLRDEPIPCQQHLGSHRAVPLHTDWHLPLRKKHKSSSQDLSRCAANGKHFQEEEDVAITRDP